MRMRLKLFFIKIIKAINFNENPSNGGIPAIDIKLIKNGIVKEDDFFTSIMEVIRFMLRYIIG